MLHVWAAAYLFVCHALESFVTENALSWVIVLFDVEGQSGVAWNQFLLVNQAMFTAHVGSAGLSEMKKVSLVQWQKNWQLALAADDFS